MLSTTHPLYAATCEIKRGNEAMPCVFKLLTGWISEHTGVTVLNIAFRRASEQSKPRLTLVLESEKDWQLACNRNGQLKPDFRKFVVYTLEALAPRAGVALTFRPEDLLVEAERFASVALYETISRAFNGGKIQLLQKLSRYNIYEIRKVGHQTMLVYYTEESQRASELSGEREVIRQIFADYLLEFDAFGYCSTEDLPLCYDNLERRNEISNVTRFTRTPLNTRQSERVVAAPQVPVRGSLVSLILQQAGVFLSGASKRVALF